MPLHLYLRNFHPRFESLSVAEIYNIRMSDMAGVMELTFVYLYKYLYNNNNNNKYFILVKLKIKRYYDK
jgi:hypothetical protein